MTRSPAKCGTVSGRAAHYRRGEPVCPACRDEYNRYTREARNADGYAAAARRRRNTAWSAAAARLRREYPDRFKELLAEELKARPL